jgi:hypothetical protein
MNNDERTSADAAIKMQRANDESQSGRGQPHSRTLSRLLARHSFRGCPLPLSLLASTRAHSTVSWHHAALF